MAVVAWGRRRWHSNDGGGTGTAAVARPRWRGREQILREWQALPTGPSTRRGCPRAGSFASALSHAAGGGEALPAPALGPRRLRVRSVPSRNSRSPPRAPDEGTNLSRSCHAPGHGSAPLGTDRRTATQSCHGVKPHPAPTAPGSFVKFPRSTETRSPVPGNAGRSGGETRPIAPAQGGDGGPMGPRWRVQGACRTGHRPRGFHRG